MRISTALITSALILITGGAVAQSVRVGPGGFSFRFAGTTAAAMSRASAQHARFMRASQSSKLTPTSASVAAYKGQPGTTIRLGISSGAGMCHGSALRRHNAADLKTCSAASIGSAISTTTAGGGDGAGAPNTVDLRAPL